MFKKRNKILIIDDATELAESLSLLFETHDYEVMLAHNGKQGLKKLETYEPDLIILDMDMPVMGGIEFYHTFLAQNNGQSPYPILVFTGRESLEGLFKDLEVNGFMSKPFDFDALISKVNQIFSDCYGQGSISPEATTAQKSILEESSIILFESHQNFFDEILLTLSHQDLRVIPGIQNSKVSYEEMVKQTLDQILEIKPRALVLHLPSMNPLHEDYPFIHKILKTTKTAQIPSLLYLKTDCFFSSDLAKMMTECYSVKKVSQISTATQLLKELQSIL